MYTPPTKHHPLLSRDKKNCHVHLPDDTAKALVNLINQSQTIVGVSPSVSSVAHMLIREALVTRGYLPKVD